MSEADNIKLRYEKRKEQSAGKNENSRFIKHVLEERETIYSRIIKENFKNISNLNVLEIGAGEGTNINFFRSLGINDSGIVAAELLPERTAVLKNKFPGITVVAGDAGELPYENKFDIVFQSLVFTSILDKDFKNKLAGKMWSMLKPGGIILWYDFKYNNPANKDVKGVGKTEIKKLFPAAASIEFLSATLAPPIGRRIGILYDFVNSVFPFLRTHLIAVIKK